MTWSPVVNRKAKGQIEITIIKGPVPSHADLSAAHQALHGLRIEGPTQKLQVRLLFVSPAQFRSKPPQGHIGDGEQACKNDAKALSELLPVVGLKSRLQGW